MAETIAMPKLGFDMAEGILLRWMKAEGESIEKGEILAEIETDKATVEVESQTSGVIRKHIVMEGSIVPIGAPIAVVGTVDEEIDFDAIIAEVSVQGEVAILDEPEPVPAETTVVEVSPVEEGQLPDGVKASPIARRLAREQGINLATIQGSGTGGRIVKKDVETAISGAPPIITPTIQITPPTTPAAEPLQTKELPLSKLRSLIGRRMTASKQEVPHFYLTTELDAAPLMKLRADMNRHLPEESKLSVNDYIVKAAALALQQFPNLNAALSGDHILRHGEVNIGIAVAVEDGLLTIVIRDANRKPLLTISEETRSAVARAREGRVRPEDVEGSTFTVSNLGMFDIDSFIAIINPPEAAILAIGSVNDVPVVEDGKVVPGKRLKVTLSADHRVTDGAEGARWLQVFKSIMEDPIQLLIDFGN